MSSCECPYIPQMLWRPFRALAWILQKLSSLSCCPGFGGPARASSHGARRVRAKALIEHETILLRTFFGCFGWFGPARSSFQSGLPIYPPIVLDVQHTLLLLLPLRSVEFLSLSLEDPLPLPGLPMNFPTRWLTPTLVQRFTRKTTFDPTTELPCFSAKKGC